MSKFCYGLLGLALASVTALASANAADLYRGGPGSFKDEPDFAPAATWTGFYVGINGGYGFNQNDKQFGFDNGLASISGLSPQGGFGGGQIGYNWQGAFGWNPHLVLGVEADFQGSDISDDFHGEAAGLASLRTSSELNWFGTVRGRIGYAFGPSLVYFTGGFAYGDIENKVSALAPAFGANIQAKKDTTATGYVLGGGYEYKISPAWSIKAEYQYINLGKNEPIDVIGGRFPVSTEGFSVHDDAFHTIRVGLNYHLGAIYEPLK